MSIIRVNPFLQGKSFSNILDNVFNNNISNLVGSDFEITIPSVNISENNESYVLDVAAPGLEKKDFNISVENGELIISANKNEQKEGKEPGKWTRKEFNFTSFKRSFNLSDAVVAENIEAEYLNGVLTVLLPKKEEVKSKAPKVIEIK